MRALIDTNILLDVLARRDPFYREASRIWTLAEAGRFDARISAISFNNCYYVVRKYGGVKKARLALRLLRDVFVTVDLTGRILQQSMDAGGKGFEDAIQLFSALHVGADVLVTRNAGDFPRDEIPVLAPAEFLARLALSSPEDLAE